MCIRVYVCMRVYVYTYVCIRVNLFINSFTTGHTFLCDCRFETMYIISRTHSLNIFGNSEAFASVLLDNCFLFSCNSLTTW